MLVHLLNVSDLTSLMLPGLIFTFLLSNINKRKTLNIIYCPSYIGQWFTLTFISRSHILFPFFIIQYQQTKVITQTTQEFDTAKLQPKLFIIHIIEVSVPT